MRYILTSQSLIAKMLRWFVHYPFTVYHVDVTTGKVDKFNCIDYRDSLEWAACAYGNDLAICLDHKGNHIFTKDE